MMTYERVCDQLLDIVSEQQGIDRDELHLRLRLIADLKIDSLDLTDLLMRLEEAFGVDFPAKPTDPFYANLFAQSNLRLADLADYAYVHQGRGQPGQGRRRWSSTAPTRVPPVSGEPFTQLGGVDDEPPSTGASIAPYGARDRFRRRRDGMVMVQIPADEVSFAGDDGAAVRSIDAFLIDAEPVSTTAYARFLNSIGDVDEATLRKWFVLDDADRRHPHVVLRRDGSKWHPVEGTERWPMVLVSWHGAAAYADWAHGRPVGSYQSLSSLLPTEWQWEYAARGRTPAAFPWGEEPPSGDQAWCARHTRGSEYLTAADMPLAAVNVAMGVSPFGLRHMAGNVWQWCSNAFGEDPTVRSERGGSWVGPAALCRSDYRRGRFAEARGRCLGFRCAAPLPR